MSILITEVATGKVVAGPGDNNNYCSTSSKSLVKLPPHFWHTPTPEEDMVKEDPVAPGVRIAPRNANYTSGYFLLKFQRATNQLPPSSPLSARVSRHRHRASKGKSLSRSSERASSTGPGIHRRNCSAVEQVLESFYGAPQKPLPAISSRKSRGSGKASGTAAGATTSTSRENLPSEERQQQGHPNQKEKKKLLSSSAPHLGAAGSSLVNKRQEKQGKHQEMKKEKMLKDANMARFTSAGEHSPYVSSGSLPTVRSTRKNNSDNTLLPENTQQKKLAGKESGEAEQRDMEETEGGGTLSPMNCIHTDMGGDLNAGTEPILVRTDSSCSSSLFTSDPSLSTATSLAQAPVLCLSDGMHGITEADATHKAPKDQDKDAHQREFRQWSNTLESGPHAVLPRSSLPNPTSSSPPLSSFSSSFQSSLLYDSSVNGREEEEEEEEKKKERQRLRMMDDASQLFARLESMVTVFERRNMHFIMRLHRKMERRIEACDHKISEFEAAWKAAQPQPEISEDDAYLHVQEVHQRSRLESFREYSDMLPHRMSAYRSSLGSDMVSSLTSSSRSSACYDDYDDKEPFPVLSSSSSSTTSSPKPAPVCVSREDFRSHSDRGSSGDSEWLRKLYGGYKIQKESMKATKLSKQKTDNKENQGKGTISTFANTNGDDRREKKVKNKKGEKGKWQGDGTSDTSSDRDCKDDEGLIDEEMEHALEEIALLLGRMSDSEEEPEGGERGDSANGSEVVTAEIHRTNPPCNNNDDDDLEDDGREPDYTDVVEKGLQRLKDDQVRKALQPVAREGAAEEIAPEDDFPWKTAVAFMLAYRDQFVLSPEYQRFGELLDKQIDRKVLARRKVFAEAKRKDYLQRKLIFDDMNPFERPTFSKYAIWNRTNAQLTIKVYRANNADGLSKLMAAASRMLAPDVRWLFETVWRNIILVITETKFEEELNQKKGTRKIKERKKKQQVLINKMDPRRELSLFVIKSGEGPGRRKVRRRRHIPDELLGNGMRVSREMVIPGEENGSKEGIKHK